MAITQVSYNQNSPYYGTPLFANGKFLDLLNYRVIPFLLVELVDRFAAQRVFAVPRGVVEPEDGKQGGLA